MPVSPARTAAFEILLRVERENSYASELLHSSQYAAFTAKDRSLATELVMGVLRWRSLLDQHISEVSSQRLTKLDIEVLIALRLAIYQMLYLHRIPARAAIHESVELVKRARKRSAAPFVNAVLRKFSAFPRKANAIDSILQSITPAALARASAHPEWLVERWLRVFGLDITKLICKSDQSVPATVIRLRDPAAEAELRNQKIELAPGTFLASARRVESGDVTKTKAFADARITLQNEGSQLVAMLVGRGARLLDCCAAPGGKTAILADRNPQSTVIAAELHPHRARLLRALTPARNVHVVTADARNSPFATQFDRVLADVPCSGTGTLARNPEIKWRLQPQDLADLQSRQLAILRAAMSQVVPGGRIIYSTCSLEPEENSDVVETALAAANSFRLLDCRTELDRLKREGELVLQDVSSVLNGKFLRTIPGVDPCEGFFAAILERI